MQDRCSRSRSGSAASRSSSRSSSKDSANSLGHFDLLKKPFSPSTGKPSSKLTRASPRKVSDKLVVQTAAPPGRNKAGMQSSLSPSPGDNRKRAGGKFENSDRGSSCSKKRRSNSKEIHTKSVDNSENESVRSGCSGNSGSRSSSTAGDRKSKVDNSGKESVRSGGPGSSGGKQSKVDNSGKESVRSGGPGSSGGKKSKVDNSGKESVRRESVGGGKVRSTSDPTSVDRRRSHGTESLFPDGEHIKDRVLAETSPLDGPNIPPVVEKVRNSCRTEASQSFQRINAAAETLSHAIDVSKTSSAQHKKAVDATKKAVLDMKSAFLKSIGEVDSCVEEEVNAVSSVSMADKRLGEELRNFMKTMKDEQKVSQMHVGEMVNNSPSWEMVYWVSTTLVVLVKCNIYTIQYTEIPTANHFRV
jgi:hypothetical protein